MNLESALAALTRDIPLPGDAARSSMMPEYRRFPRPGSEPSAWKNAAVLVLLYPYAGKICFPLMLRPDGAGVHAGQISLPGGSLEGDESPEDCALRETREELGVNPEDVRIVRALSPLRIAPSSFRVRPFVGVRESRPEFRPAPAEVTALLETSLEELLDAESRKEEPREFGGRAWRVPYYRLASGKVWGATAMILAELEALLRMEGGPQG